MANNKKNNNSNEDEKINNLSSSIKDYEGIYDFYSAEASKIARQLAFSIGAIVWLLYSSTNCQYKLLISATYITLVLFFISDLTQYLFGAFKFFWLIDTLSNVREQNLDPNLKYEYPFHFIKPLTTLNIIKFIFLGISSILLIIMFAIFLTHPY